MEISAQTFIELRKLLDGLPAMVFLLHAEGDDEPLVLRSEGILAQRWKLDTEHTRDLSLSRAFPFTGLKTAVKKALKGKPQSIDFEYEGGWYTCRLEPFDDFGEISDVTGTVMETGKSHRAEQENLVLQQSLYAVAEPLAIFDLNYRITHANPAMEKLFEYPGSEMLGRFGRSLLAPSNPSEVVEAVLPETVKGGWSGELVAKTRTGREFPMFLRSTPIRSPGGDVLALVALVRDISAEKKVETQRDQAERDKRQLALSLGSYARMVREELKPHAEAMAQLLPESAILHRSGEKANHSLVWFSRHFKTAFLALIEGDSQGLLGAMQTFTSYNLLNVVVNDERVFDPNRVLQDLEEKLVPFAKLNENPADARLRIGFMAIATENLNVKFAGAGLHAFMLRGGKAKRLTGTDQPLMALFDGENLTERYFDPESEKAQSRDLLVLASHRAFAAGMDSAYLNQHLGPHQNLNWDDLTQAAQRVLDTLPGSPPDVTLVLVRL